MYVILVFIPSGHSRCNLSLFNCMRKTISTNNALNMKNAKTDLFRNSIKSDAIRDYICYNVHDSNFDNFLII